MRNGSTKWKQNGNKMERQRLNSLGIGSEVVRLWGMAQKHKRGISALAVTGSAFPSLHNSTTEIISLIIINTFIINITIMISSGRF